jgi:hypothetical protein
LDQLPAGGEIDRDMLVDYFQKIISVVILRAAPSSLKAPADLLQIPEGNISRHLDLFYSVLTVPVNPNLPNQALQFSFRNYLVDEPTKIKEFYIPILA